MKAGHLARLFSLGGDMKAIRFAALILLAAVSVQAQPPTPTTDVKALDKAMHDRFGDVETAAIPIGLPGAQARDALAFLFSPYASFRMDITERVRKMEPVTDLVYPTEATVTIFPDRIIGPNIIKVVVQRNGVIVEPLRSTLGPREFTAVNGGKRERYAGIVVYPLSTFAPGATVTVTLVPECCANVVKKLSDKQLERFK
jgi:hypothetical protein